MTRRIIIVAAALVAAGTTASATGAVYKRIGTASSSGDYAIALATGTAKRPIAGIYVSTTATPRQSVSVNWTMVCSKGYGAGSKSGSYTTSSALKRKLRLPMSKADSCTVSASGSLASGGKITVRLFKK